MNMGITNILISEIKKKTVSDEFPNIIDGITISGLNKIISEITNNDEKYKLKEEK